VRDHTKLKAFQLADALAVSVYKETANFPKAEQYGLTLQLRRSAVSVPSNIVEGCARQSEADYLHFLDIAYASARELDYQLSLAVRLGHLPDSAYTALASAATETAKVLSGLIRALRR
jgi:four helix bundle protein